MAAPILRLRALPSYEEQLEIYAKHLRVCCLCDDHQLCEEGLSLNYLAWALMCPVPRPSARKATARRRSG